MTAPLLALACLAAAAPAEDGPRLAEAHAVLVAEAERFRRAAGDAAWPGLGAIDVPVVLQVGERDWLVGFREPVEGFETVPATPPLGGAVQVGARSRAADLAAAFVAHGRPAVVIATPEALGRSPAQWILDALHESFHVLQMRRGEVEKVAELAIGPADDASWQLDFPFPYGDEHARALVHQAGWACWVGSEHPSDAEARYAAAESGYESSPEFLALEGAEPLDGLAETARGARFLAKHAGRASATRTVHYHAGLAKAMLLERLDPAWKERYFEPGTWLDDLLAEASKAAPASSSE